MLLEFFLRANFIGCNDYVFIGLQLNTESSRLNLFCFIASVNHELHIMMENNTATTYLILST